MAPQDTMTFSHIGHLCINFPFCSILIGITFFGLNFYYIVFCCARNCLLWYLNHIYTAFRGYSGTISHIGFIISFKKAIERFSLTMFSILSMADRFSFAALLICCRAMYEILIVAFPLLFHLHLFYHVYQFFFCGSAVSPSCACILSS